MQKFSIIILTLPNGTIALQRRTQDAPHAPGRLGLFGGWVENDETPEECIKRELEEETSLKASELAITPVDDFILPASQAFPKDRHFYLYKTAVQSADFDVFEGDGAEVYSLEELRKRDDLTPSSEFAFRKVIRV